MLALAQSLAEALDADVIYTGVNALDYSGYVDCRPEFIDAWNQFAQSATFRAAGGHPIWVEAPLVQMSKVDIVRRGLELQAPLHLTWSCYAGQSTPCGLCDSCKIRQAAFKELRMADPAEEGIENAV
jgi:7-cyano-7-deazaguanine synthase